MKCIALILFFSALHIGIASGQDVSVNRKKMINMILGQSHIKVGADGFYHSANANSIISAGPPSSQGFHSVSSIPRYCLAKGAVICRLEEYVQLHSPFKLNIGVGGE